MARLSGNYREEIRTRRVEYRPGTLVMHPEGVEHRDEVGDGGASFLLVEFRELEAGWRPDFDVEGGEAVWAAYRLLRCAPGLEMEEGVAELSLALRKRRMVVEGERPAWFARIEERLRHEYANPPGLRELAVDAGVHPVHLSRTWRRFRGVGIGEFVMRRRIVEAWRRMGDPMARLVEIAADLGFADQSHRARHFKRVTGTTAGEFRRLLSA